LTVKLFGQLDPIYKKKEGDMHRRLSISSLILGILYLLIFLTPRLLSAAPPTGSPLTPEWIKYNEQAETKNLPRLSYLVTCKKITGPKKSKEPEEITDTFSLKDRMACVYVRWSDVSGSPVCTLRIYDPRGVLFKEWERTFKRKKPVWNQWFRHWIKDAPASKLPGKWTAEILMDGVLAARKEFVIGDTNVQYKQISYDKNVSAISVFPFVPAGDRGKMFDYEAPTLIAQMMSIDYPDHRVILPSEIDNEITVPTHVKIEEFVNDTINSKVLDDLITKYNINLFIAGSARAYGRTTRGEKFTVKFDIFIIDGKSKAVAKKFDKSWSPVRDYKDARDLLILHACSSVYKTLMKKAKDDIEKILTKK
jgi:hypothetical protein